MLKILSKLVDINRSILFGNTQLGSNAYSKAAAALLPESNLENIDVGETPPDDLLNRDIFHRYMSLPIPENKVHATYIWIDGTGESIRCQSKTLDFNPISHKEVTNCTYNGSQTFQANINNPDCYLVPVAMYNDPIKKGTSKVVLCEAFDANEKPCKTNHRQKCVEILNKACDSEIEVGFEQEYLLTNKFGVPCVENFLGEGLPTEFHYASTGAGKVYGREITECFYRSCLYAGINITGDIAGKVLGQWEFKIGPSPTIKAADDLWTARYLLTRISEDYGVGISFEPKFSQQYPGAALNTTFSTKFTRNDQGIKFINDALRKLEKKHQEHIKVYDAHNGADNRKRLTGKFKTSSADFFTCGVADRTLSVRIPKLVNIRKKGHLEDQRPAANADPYQVITALVNTCLLE